MKRMIFAIAIIIVIVGIVASGTHYVKQANDVMTNYIKKIETAAKQDNPKQALMLCEAAEKEWVNFEKKLNLFVNHAEICEIGVGISAMKPIIEHNEKAEFFSQLNEVKVMLTHLASMENINSK